MARPIRDRALTPLPSVGMKQLATQLEMYRGRIKKRYDWRLNAS